MIEVRAAADLSVLRTIDPCIDPTDAQGVHPSDAGRTCAGLALWGGEAYVLDHPSAALASARCSSACLPRVRVFNATSGAHARSWELPHSSREGRVLARLLSLCVGACGGLVLSLEHGSSAGSSASSHPPSQSGRQAALVLRLHTHQGEPLLTTDLAQRLPAAARGALWRCESASIGPALEGHGEGAEWLYVTGRRSTTTSAVLNADAAPQPQWDESSCVGFVWAFGFRA